MLKGEWERDYHAFPDLYEIGCAGKISNLTKLPDGRYNLILNGLAEFRVVREVRERSYRQAEVQWCPAPPEQLVLDDQAMADLRELLVAYLGEPAREVWRSHSRAARAAQCGLDQLHLFPSGRAADREADAARSARRADRMPDRRADVQARGAQARPGGIERFIRPASVGGSARGSASRGGVRFALSYLLDPPLSFPKSLDSVRDGVTGGYLENGWLETIGAHQRHGSGTATRDLAEH